MGLNEFEIQRDLYKRFKIEYPDMIQCFQASLNGVNLSAFGKRKFAMINAMKSSGMCVGQSDIFIAVPRHNFCGKYIELKTRTGKPTQAQLDFGDKMLEMGYAFEIAKGYDAGWAAIKSYLC